MSNKVLGTTIVANNRILDPLRFLGYNRRNNQFRIICGCKGRADANRQCEAMGLRRDTFQAAYASETFNAEELLIAGNGGLYICFETNTGKRYISLEELLNPQGDKECQL